MIRHTYHVASRVSGDVTLIVVIVVIVVIEKLTPKKSHG